MSNVDVLFIHPSDQKGPYQELAGEFTAIATPAWTLLIANYLRSAGHSVAVFDCNIHGWNQDSANEVLSKFSPQLVVMMVYGHNPSASTQTMPAARRISSDLKSFNGDLPIALGGIHPSALPERTLIEEDIDYVIHGEGPYTLKALVEVYKGEGALQSVPGLWYRDNDGQILSNAAADIIQDLDRELPNYGWDLLPDLTNYRAHNMHCFQDFADSKKTDFSDIRSPYVSLNTSLGCPYSCSYCCINTIFGKSGIRYWSIDTVIGWIDELVVKYGVRNFRFDDELFILSPKRVEAFCDKVIERGYDLNIWVYGRVDTIRESLLGKMKQAGINWICLGIESGNEQVRNGVNKSIKRDIGDIVRSIQSHDIYVLGNYMFGMPGDNLSTMQQTLDLALELNCEFSNFYSVMAYPGSELYRLVLGNAEGLPDSWEGFSQLGYDTYPLPGDNLSSAQILEFRDKAVIKAFTNQKYAAMIGRRFGVSVNEHLERMLKHKLKRKILE